MLHSLLADLLSRLQADGFEMGISKHLQVQELMNRLPDNFTEEELGSFICPLFARNAAEQEHFYELYQESLKTYRVLHSEKEIPPIKEPTPSYKWLQQLGWAALVGLVSLVVYLAYNTMEEPCPMDLSTLEYSVTLHPGDSLLQCPIAIGDLEDSRLILDSLWFEGGADSLGRPDVHIVHDTCLSVIIPDSLSAILEADSLARPTFSYKALVHQHNCSDTLAIFIRVEKPLVIVSEPIIKEPDTIVQTNSYDTLALPYSKGLASLALDPEVLERQAFLDQNLWWIKLLAIGLAMLALWAFLRYRRRQQQEVIAELESRDKPPFVWDIPFPEKARIISSEATLRLIRQFRRRGLGEEAFMDMKETVQATVRNAGRLTPMYQAHAQSADYVLLINRLTRRDHRAQFYDYLFHLLKSEEVHIERFFYKGDPRLCWNEENPKGISLQALAQRYGHHRLVILSSGAEFFNPLTGRLARWSKLLENWNLRLILSPKAWNKWGRKEFRLGERIPLIPASADGLHMVVEQWNNREELPGDWARQIGDAQEAPIPPKASVAQIFSQHLPPHLHDWVAACAIFPSLQWELTLFLGQQLSEMEGEELLTTQHLQELSRLPWFVTGKMPEEVRAQLLERLDDRIELELRVRLQELFETLDAPHPKSGAFDDYTLSLVINELHLKVSPERKKELKEQLKTYLAAGAEADWVVLKALEKPREGVDYRLPRNFHKLAEQGQKPESRKTQLRQNIALGVLGSLLLAILMPFHPQLDSCEGEQITVGNLQLCLNDFSDSLLYYQHELGERLKVYDFQGAQDVLNRVTVKLDPNEVTGYDQIMIEKDPSLKAFFTNSAFLYFNQGLRYLNSKQKESFDPEVKDTLCAQLMRVSKVLQPIISQPLDTLLARLDHSHYQFLCYPLWESDSTEDPCSNIFLEANNLLQRGCTANQFKKLLDRARKFCPSNRSDLQDFLEKEYQQLLTQERNSLVPSSTSESTSAIGDSSVRQTTGFVVGNSGFVTVNGEVRVPLKRSALEGYTLNINGNTVPVRASRSVDVGTFSFMLSIPQGQLTCRARIQIDSDQYQNIDETRTFQLDSAGQAYYTLEPIRLEVGGNEEVNIEPIVPEMVFVQGGSFMMGSPEDEEGREKDEVLHRVRLDDYEIGKYEVTNREYVRFLNANAGRTDSIAVWIDLEGTRSRISFSGESYTIAEGYERHPVLYVSWYGAQAYCRWLNEAQAGGKTGWRLPSEAQWEYAAAGGVKGYDPKGSRRYIYAGTSNGDSLSYYANYSTNGEERVGGRYPNPLGIHDMSGNIWEWCGDWYGEYQGEGVELQNPLGPATGISRVVRGGSWDGVNDNCRVSDRSYLPTLRSNLIGFRVSRYSPR